MSGLRLDLTIGAVQRMGRRRCRLLERVDGTKCRHTCARCADLFMGLGEMIPGIQRVDSEGVLGARDIIRSCPRDEQEKFDVLSTSMNNNHQSWGISDVLLCADNHPA